MREESKPMRSPWLESIASDMRPIALLSLPRLSHFRGGICGTSLHHTDDSVAGREDHPSSCSDPRKGRIVHQGVRWT